MAAVALQLGGQPPGARTVAELDWRILLGIIAVLVGVLMAPYDLLMLVQRRWEQRRRERIARGEDVTPKKLPWDLE